MILASTPKTLFKGGDKSTKAHMSPRVSWILATPRLSAKMTLMRAATPPMEMPKRVEAAAAVGKSVTRKPENEKGSVWQNITSALSRQRQKPWC